MIKLITTILLVTSTLSYSELSVNKNIRVSQGEHRKKGCSTVNGSIIVEPDARIDGQCRTVNGAIIINKACRVEGAESINGSVRIGEDCEIDDDIKTVNGAIRCENGVTVGHNVETVNGGIRLQGSRVKGKLATYNGDITLEDGSVVQKDIIVKDSKGNSRGKVLEIVVDKSVVKGDIRNKSRRNKVVVYLLNGGEVHGEIINAKVERD